MSTDFAHKNILVLGAGVTGTSVARFLQSRGAQVTLTVDNAEGAVKPGGTIVECTSGNTGMGLALVALSRGYKCVFTLADKMSKEKVDILRAMGAEVHVCPTNVEPEDPRSYYSVAARIAKERNGWNPDQYNNLSNTYLYPLVFPQFL